VNGVQVTVPVTLPNGIKIFLSGTFVVLDTDFGLRVRFDGNHHADVTLPSSYSGLLCGLCGKDCKFNYPTVLMIIMKTQELKSCY